MKCSQCKEKATNSGSGLCKACEDEVMEEYKKQCDLDKVSTLESLKRDMC